jgi:hypothetical protein
MADDTARKIVMAPDETAVAKAHAAYTPAMLRFYDLLVHGLSNRLAWCCPTQALLDLYRASLSGNHLEAGVGTGFFLDRAGRSQFNRLALLDINRHCLDRARQRLSRFKPELHEANLLAPLKLDTPPFASIGLTYVLHCLPGNMREKLAALDHLRPLMQADAVLFGATILGRGIAPNLAARTLLGLYNAKGIFNNREDDLATLADGLRHRFGKVEIETSGLVALFRAT